MGNQIKSRAFQPLLEGDMEDAADWRAAEESLNSLAANPDMGHAQQEADTVLCQLLRQLGYGGVAEAWRRVHKLHA